MSSAVFPYTERLGYQAVLGVQGRDGYAAVVRAAFELNPKENFQFLARRIVVAVKG